MSDFLTRLVERTLGLAPVAKPIITPIFAPNILNDNPPDSVWNNESQIADKAEPTPSRENLSAFSKSDHVDETSNESQIADKAEPIPSRKNLSAFSKSDHVDETSNEPQVPDKAEPTPTRANLSSFSKSDHVDATRVPDTMTGRNDNNTFKPVSKAVNPERLSSYKPLKEDTRGYNEHFADMISSDQNQRDKPEPEQSFKVQNDSSELQIDSNKLSITRIGTQAAPEVQHTKTSILRQYVPERIHPSYVATPTSSSSTPTIQVTIGRIEVRAITPPVIPAQRSRAPNPTLSLDDYLKQRNRRQR